MMRLFVHPLVFVFSAFFGIGTAVIPPARITNPAVYAFLRQHGNFYNGPDAWTSPYDSYLQPSDVGLNPIYDEYQDDGIICARDCTLHPEQRICYYKFVAEQYSSMGPACDNCSAIDQQSCYNPQCVQADGVEKTVLTLNRQIPGPIIQVCQHDRIIVDVYNKLLGRPLTIHWHGILQWQSPWMDGVPNLNQCPIGEGAKFRYSYLADICGTHFYHSHVGFQQIDGLFGGLIIRQNAALDPNSHEYDFDLTTHVVILNDWIHQPIDAAYPGRNKNMSLPTQLATNYLVNGRGSYKAAGSNINTAAAPHTFYRVRSGFRYRFRFISATSFVCPVHVTLQNHKLTLISVDGNPCYNKQIGSMVFVSGDRYDVVVHANQPPGVYNLVIKGAELCAGVPEQTAYIVYDDLPPQNPIPYNIDTIWQYPKLDYVARGCILNDVSICSDEIRSIYPVPSRLLKPVPDYRIFLSASGHIYTRDELFRTNTFSPFEIPNGGPAVGGVLVSDMFNNISSFLPPFPLLTQNQPLPPEFVCPTVCNKPICRCTHIYKFKLNSIVELVLTDDLSSRNAKFFHPQHLHGQHFVVLKQGSAEERRQSQFWLETDLMRNPLFRDVVTSPPNGYAIVRFEASNPGFWLFHCHFLFHFHGGMDVVFQFGEREQFLRIPPDVPKCGDYLPLYD